MIRKHSIWCSFLALILLATIFSLNGCASPEQNARTFLDRIEFDETEYGSFEVEGTIDLNALPFATTNVHLKLEKFKDKPGQLEEVTP